MIRPTFKYKSVCEHGDCLNDAVVQYVHIDEEESVYLDNRCEEHLMTEEEALDGEWDAREIMR